MKKQGFWNDKIEIMSRSNHQAKSSKDTGIENSKKVKYFPCG